MADETVYVMDAMSTIHQVFHAYPYMESPRTHKAVQAVYGSIKDLLNFYRDFSPEYIVAAFDARGKNFRHEMFPDYKANRPPTDPDLVDQFPYIRKIYEAFRIPCFVESGVEADDVISTLARRAVADGYRARIVSIDKDIRQIVDERITILNLRAKTVMDKAGVQEKMGVRPDQVVDYLAIVGDTADNISGLPGVGAKGAATLLAEYDTLENAIANAAYVKATKARNSLRDHADLVRLGQRLIRLRDDVPLEIDFQACRVQPPDLEALKGICDECGFNELWHEIQQQFTVPAPEPIESYNEPIPDGIYGSPSCDLLPGDAFDEDLPW